MLTTVLPAMPAAAVAAAQEVAARDATIAWFRGEFAAANAIIDALIAHMELLDGGGEGYRAVFTAVHRRRMNWIPVIHMQKYYPIADIINELLRASASPRAAPAAEAHFGGGGVIPQENSSSEAPVSDDALEKPAINKNENDDEICEAHPSTESSNLQQACIGGEATLPVSCGEHQQIQGPTENVSTGYACDALVACPDRIKASKGFIAKEQVKGHMVNVVKGLKLYEDVFIHSQLLELAEYISNLRLAGRRGELSGDTFIFFNKEMKGNKREIIQLGAPLFQQTREDTTGKNEPMPPILQSIVDHLVQWRLIPESRKPNSCLINFFDEDEHSQPYQKPPHLDNPISTLVLSETTMTFGRMLVSDNHGNYNGSLSLQLKEGSLLVMRGNSADIARHVVSSSSNRRVIVTFVKVRAANDHVESPAATQTSEPLALWQPGAQLTSKVSGGGTIGYISPGTIPTWGMTLRSPFFMLSPRPMIMGSSKKSSHNGTGVFLPWTVGPKKYARHLPPRIQKRRLSSHLEG